jgi:hypothetical protein
MPRAALGVAAGEIIEGEKHGEARQARNLPIAFPGREFLGRFWGGKVI